MLPQVFDYEQSLYHGEQMYLPLPSFIGWKGGFCFGTVIELTEVEQIGQSR